MKKKVKKPLRDENSLVFRKYRTRVDQIVNECRILSREVFGWTIAQWADKADISDQSIYNLITRTTRYPWFNTIYMLAKAVGAEVWVEQVKEKEVKAQRKGVKV